MGGIGTPVAILIGVTLLVVGIGLFFLDTFKPGFKRDSDKVYGILFMTLGILSLANWQAGFGVSLLLMVSAGTLIALIIERINGRTVNHDPVYQESVRSARRESERPSRGYRSMEEEAPRTELRVELDNDRYTPIEVSRPRRIRGTGERSSRDSYTDPYAVRSDFNDGYSDYSDQSREETRSARRGSRRSRYEEEGQYGQTDSSSRRPLQLEGDLKGGGYSDPYGSTQPASRRRGGSSPQTDDVLPSEEPMTPSPRGRRRRPRTSNGDRPTDETYVDYKPIQPSDYPGDDEFDNSNNFDDGPKFS